MPIHGPRGNVIVEGGTGTGKSYPACRMAKQACRMRRSALHKAARPADGARRASGDRALRRQDSEEVCAYELLVIDEWLTEDIEDVAIRFLLELVERRYMNRSTVLYTQYSPAD